MLLLIWEVLSYESLYFLQMEIIDMHKNISNQLITVSIP